MKLIDEVEKETCFMEGPKDHVKEFKVSSSSRYFVLVFLKHGVQNGIPEHGFVLVVKTPTSHMHVDMSSSSASDSAS